MRESEKNHKFSSKRLKKPPLTCSNQVGGCHIAFGRQCCYKWALRARLLYQLELLPVELDTWC